MADLKAEIKIETAKEIVTNAPIADVAEVKRGKMIIESIGEACVYDKETGEIILSFDV